MFKQIAENITKRVSEGLNRNVDFSTYRILQVCQITLVESSNKKFIGSFHCNDKSIMVYGEMILLSNPRCFERVAEMLIKVAQEKNHDV